MTADQKVIKNKLAMLKLAEKLGNILFAQVLTLASFRFHLATDTVV